MRRYDMRRRCGIGCADRRAEPWSVLLCAVVVTLSSRFRHLRQLRHSRPHLPERIADIGAGPPDPDPLVLNQTRRFSFMFEHGLFARTGSRFSRSYSKTRRRSSSHVRRHHRHNGTTGATTPAAAPAAPDGWRGLAACVRALPICAARDASRGHGSSALPAWRWRCRHYP